jgi:hypothetical protein
MNKEINYLKEHLYEIYKYKKSQKDLTYDMDLELLLRTCKALDFIQQENQQLKKQKDDVVEFLNTTDSFVSNVGKEKILRMLGEIDNE